MENNCCAPNNNIMPLACSGGSNVGQPSNNEDILRVKEAVVAACKGQKTETQAAKLSRVVGCC